MVGNLPTTRTDDYRLMSTIIKVVLLQNLAARSMPRPLLAASMVADRTTPPHIPAGHRIGRLLVVQFSRLDLVDLLEFIQLCEKVDIHVHRFLECLLSYDASGSVTGAA